MPERRRTESWIDLLRFLHHREVFVWPGRHGNTTSPRTLIELLGLEPEIKTGVMLKHQRALLPPSYLPVTMIKLL
jgi:hypothetical protein